MTTTPIVRWSLAIIAALILAAGAIFPQTASAGGTHSQISVVNTYCRKIMRPRVGWEPQCSPADISILRIEGYNQNGDYVVWDYFDKPCEADGNNKNFVRGWWWAIERGTKVTISGAHIGTREVYLKRDRPTYSYWHRISFRTTVEEMYGLKGTPHTQQSDWGTDKIPPAPW